jgi:thioredoxin-related protein
MKRVLYLIGVVVGLQRTVFALDPVAVQSVAALKALQAEAAPEKRMVVLFFTSSAGSCRDCDMMKRKFYSDRQFMSWVGQFAVLGEVDVSVGRTDFQDGRETYHMVGGDIAELTKVARWPELPSIALYGNDGKFYDWALAQDDPGAVMIAFHKVFQRQVANVPLPDFSKSFDAEPIASAPAAPTLKLKMISGTPQRRLATINDETFFAGETHRISLGDRKLAVQCLGIREKSVLVKVEGEAKSWELPLGEPRHVQSAAVEPETPGPRARRLKEAMQDPEFRRRYENMSNACLVTTSVVLVLYLPFSWSCWQLCRRAGSPSTLLVWLPVLKRLALFRAADVSWFLFLCGLVIPFVGFCAWILCCGRLCETFHKTKWWLLLMIWPVIGWPVFMYLAWSSRADDDEPAIRALDRGRQYA